FIGDTPHVFEHDRSIVEVGAVHDVVAVSGEVRVHVIEVAVSAVDEVDRVAVLPEYSSERGEMSVVRAADDGLTRYGRRADRQRFEAAHGARTGREDAVKLPAFACEAIEIGRQSFSRAICAEK